MNDYRFCGYVVEEKDAPNSIELVDKTKVIKWYNLPFNKEIIEQATEPGAGKALMQHIQHLLKKLE